MLVCIGIPTHDGKPCANTVDSLLAEQLLGFREGVHFIVLWEIGCSLIGAARNMIARRFLASPADCLVMVDSDISWKAGDLRKLAQSPHDVIGGTYRIKTDDLVHFHAQGTPEPVSDNLYKVEGLPGGFMKISRKAFEAIPANQYEHRDGKPVNDFFPTGFHDGRFYGEDYGFCRLWREAGGSVFLDTSIKLRHHDGMRAFEGDPDEWVRKALDGTGDL